ncbi:MAG: glycoside hydrolase family 3 protein, partial [Bacteroidota bacterium]
MRLFSFWQPALLVTVFLSSCALPQVDTSPGGTDPVTSSSEPSTEIDTSFAGPHPPDISSATTIPTFSFLTVEQNAFVIAEVARMDLRQKIGQMTQVSADMVCKGNLYELTVPYEFDEEKLRKVFVDYQVGSILNYPTNNYLVPAEWYVFMQRLQRMALQNGDVPLLYGQDAIHGPNYVYGATLFPQPLGLAATFNRDLARESAAVCAYEMKAASIPWNFSPAMDLGRSPVWPRIWESFGEDLYLNQEMGLASLQGYQGDDLTDLGSVAACLKHFTGYGNPASGRDRTPAYIPERQLREYHLPQYQTAIDAGALSIMISSAEINGIPSHANKELLTDILRGEMGFEGLVVSDWADFNKLIYTHRVAADIKEATRMAVLAGIDMCMVPVSFDFCDALYELVEEGSVPMFRIDEAVSRVLAVKVAMGLYEQNNWNPVEFPLFGGTQHQALSRSAAEEAVVLLKNEELLPLSSDTRVLITGPSANTMRSL